VRALRSISAAAIVTTANESEKFQTTMSSIISIDRSSRPNRSPAILQTLFSPVAQVHGVSQFSLRYTRMAKKNGEERSKRNKEREFFYDGERDRFHSLPSSGEQSAESSVAIKKKKEKLAFSARRSERTCERNSAARLALNTPRIRGQRTPRSATFSGFLFFLFEGVFLARERRATDHEAEVASVRYRFSGKRSSSLSRLRAYMRAYPRARTHVRTGLKAVFHRVAVSRD